MNDPLIIDSYSLPLLENLVKEIWPHSDKWRLEKGRKYSMWQAAKLRARKKGLEFLISVEDIKIPESCPLLGLKLSFEDFGIRYNSPSLDRKDSSKGYIKDNIWVISSRANILKNDATIEELDLLVKNLKLCGFTYAQRTRPL